jgi:hypothetical protein
MALKLVALIEMVYRVVRAAVVPGQETRMVRAEPGHPVRGIMAALVKPEVTVSLVVEAVLAQLAQREVLAPTVESDFLVLSLVRQCFTRAAEVAGGLELVEPAAEETA